MKECDYLFYSKYLLESMITLSYESGSDPEFWNGGGEQQARKSGGGAGGGPTGYSLSAHVSPLKYDLGELGILGYRGFNWFTQICFYYPKKNKKEINSENKV